jgi:hypothetical protein
VRRNLRRAMANLVPSRLTSLAALVSLSIASLVACGGGGTPPANTAMTPQQQQANMDKAGEPPLPTKPDSDKVTWKQDPSFAKCHNDVKTGADINAGVAAIAAPCASLMKLTQIGTTSSDTYKNLDPAHTIPLHAKAGHCYRVYGLSVDALQDLDIGINDSAGKMVAEDGSDSPDAVVLEDGMVCYTVDDESVINIAAGSGAGNYAVQVWGT